MTSYLACLNFSICS